MCSSLLHDFRGVTRWCCSHKASDPGARLWYATAAVEHSWSRNVLVHQIESKLHSRAGKSIKNFKAILPPSDVFDFVVMTDKRNERELEGQLIKHVEKFLLELGQGFAFVGEQVRLVIGGDEFFADLLFYRLKLRVYVVIELKATKFGPGYVGQIGMYMAAVDDLLAHPEDKPNFRKAYHPNTDTAPHASACGAVSAVVSF